MKILKSTRKGMNKDDFNFTDDEELLSPIHECDDPCLCGCNRSLAGIETRKATTIFEVHQIEMNPEDYYSYIAKNMENKGFGIKYSAYFAIVKGKELLDVANQFPIGTVLKRSGRKFMEIK